MRAPRLEPRPPAIAIGRAAIVVALAPALAWLDRGVAAGVVEALRADLWLTDFQLGLVASAPALLAALAVPAYGSLAARLPRPRLLAGGLLLWTAATVLAASARGHASLLAARAASGVGVAAALALVPALLDDARGIPRERRRAWTLAAAGGCAVGYVLASLVGARLGWRAAFVAEAAIGAVLAAAVARAPDAPVGEGAAAWSSLRDAGFAATARRLRASPAATPGLVGVALYALGVSALASWLPAFLERVRGVPRRFAGVEAGIVFLMTAVAGAAAGGAALARLRERGRAGELWAASAATLGGAGLLVLAVFARHAARYLPALVVALVVLAAAATPILAAISRAAAGPDRAAALALVALAAFAAGDAPAAAALGIVSDARSLWWAFLAVPAALAASGIAFAVAARRAARPPPGVQGTIRP